MAIAIFAVLSTLIVPRLVGNQKREFDRFVHQVSDLLLMYAHRDHLDRRPLGLRVEGYGETSQLELVVLDTTDRTADWEVDRFVDPVRYPPFVPIQGVVIYADGEPVDLRSRVLSHLDGEDRPDIMIELEDENRRYRATLMLPPHAVTPQLVGERRSNTRERVDLDEQGRSREDW